MTYEEWMKARGYDAASLAALPPAAMLELEGDFKAHRDVTGAAHGATHPPICAVPSASDRTIKADASTSASPQEFWTMEMSARFWQWAIEQGFEPAGVSERGMATIAVAFEAGWRAETLAQADDFEMYIFASGFDPDTLSVQGRAFLQSQFDVAWHRARALELTGEAA